MTDVVEANLSFWQSHPRLRPWVDAGRLDFARFDPAADDSLELRVSGRRLVAGSLERPPVVIANYVLDGLPQDAFAIAGGQLAELTVSLHDPASPHGADDAALLGRLVIEFGRTGPVAADRYADPLRAALLDGYRERLDGTTVLMPTTAMGSSLMRCRCGARPARPGRRASPASPG